MTQQQKKPELAPATDGAQLTGNSAAKNAAENSRYVLEVTTPRTYPERRKRIEDHFSSSKLIGDFSGMWENITPQLFCESADRPGAHNAKIAAILNMIDEGYIDEETLRLTSKTEWHGQHICICLIPSCRIGPFIPFIK